MYANYARRHEGVVWVGCWAHDHRDDKCGEIPATGGEFVKLSVRISDFTLTTGLSPRLRDARNTPSLAPSVPTFAGGSPWVINV